MERAGGILPTARSHRIELSRREECGGRVPLLPFYRALPHPAFAPGAVARTHVPHRANPSMERLRRFGREARKSGENTISLESIVYDEQGALTECLAAALGACRPVAPHVLARVCRWGPLSPLVGSVVSVYTHCDTAQSLESAPKVDVLGN